MALYTIAMIAALASVAAAASLVVSEGDLLFGVDPHSSRVRRQSRRGSDRADDRQQAGRFGNANDRQYGLSSVQSEEEDVQFGSSSRRNGNNNNNNNNNRSRGSSQVDPQSQQGGRRGSANGNGSPSSSSSSYRQPDSTRTRSWGGSDTDGSGFFDNDGNNGGGNSGGGLFGGGNSGGGLFGGGGFFNRPSFLGGLIGRIGQRLASLVGGVADALSNKWDAKAAAARSFAQSLVNTGSSAARAGLQMGMAHPRFAVEAVDRALS